MPTTASSSPLSGENYNSDLTPVVPPAAGPEALENAGLPRPSEPQSGGLTPPERGGREESTVPPATRERRPQGVMYLRVSTREQAERDGDPEGYSIPAQREANYRKAEAMGVDVIAEFVDRGESARSADRPELQRMLAFIKSEPVSYCFVHKVDRLARNRADDVEINLALHAAGTQLVSATESIDETPSGMLLHGIMSSIAEFYSRNLANEVKKGLHQKVKSGGTVTRAPIGYRNHRTTDEQGREVRTVVVDEARAPLITWAFEEYAKGRTTIDQLCEELASRGLTTVTTPRRASRAIYASLLHKILTNPYYKGVVTYQGVEYPGRHEPLTTPETWARVRDVLALHAFGEKTRQHPHYLKSTIYCGRCRRRMIVHHATNARGTVYEYFVCSGRHGKFNDCEQPALAIDVAEEKVLLEYKNLAITEDLRAQLETSIFEDLEQVMADAKTARLTLSRERDRLEERRRKLLEVHLADAMPMEVLRGESDQIASRLAAINERLTAADIRYEAVQSTLATALTLARDCFEMYRSAEDTVRRQMNQAFFERIEIAIFDDEITLDTRLAAPFDTLFVKGGHRSNDEEPPTGMHRVEGSKDEVLVEGGRTWSNPAAVRELAAAWAVGLA